jgi:hypothetical protein
LVRFAQVNSDAESFRTRVIQCRDVANGTKNLEAQRELRALDKDLDNEADMIEREAMTKIEGEYSANNDDLKR